MNDVIKMIAIEALEKQKPLNILEAIVISPPPELSIKVADMKNPIPKEIISVVESLTRHKRIVTIEHSECTVRQLGDGTAEDFLHTDDLAPPYTYYRDNYVEMTFEDVLKKGDKVLVLRNQGGQKYTILDRIVTY